MNAEITQNEIAALLETHREWLLKQPSGVSFALRNSELEITSERGKILFGFLSDSGFQTWRVTAYESKNGGISLELTRNFDREKTKIELVPRISANELGENIEQARRAKAEKIAALVVENQPQTKLVRVALNKEAGRFARIILEDSRGGQTAAIADVSDTLTPENLLTTAILRLAELQKRRKNPISEIWILAEKKTAKSLQKIHALLADGWKSKIKIFEISHANADSPGKLTRLANLRTNDLWRGKLKKINLVEDRQPSAAARQIVALASGEIDAVYTKHGETLRFRGLPFARVREVFGAEKTWFGVERKRQILSEKTFEDFAKLIAELKLYRRLDAPNKHHVFYHAAPESWLEADLRRNIKRLDANLILSPLHHQFRAAGDRIDLLALRKDGRLVIIELKVSADREMIFQSVDYWRKIETLRRAGNLQRAKIFGELEIKNEPTLVYLAAPTLSFHREFEFLSGAVAPEIEIYRFDLNENWRDDLKVFRRRKL